MIKFSVGILTYGRRYNFISTVLDNLLVQDLMSIYVFCNGLEVEDEQRIKENYDDSRIIFLSSSRNLGSAGGYFQLLKHIYRYDAADYVLLLDDDNLIEEDFFSQIAGLTLETNELAFFMRPDRRIPMQAVSSQNPRLVLGPENGFLGHSIFGYSKTGVIPDCGDLIAAPYGGLLIPASVYESGVFPDQKLFLYGDDYDYTYRLCAHAGFKIRFVSYPTITDLETSFHLRKKRGFGFFYNRYSSANDEQLYFSVRNQIYLSWRDSSCRLCVIVNLCFYLPIYLTQFVGLGQTRKATLFLKSVFAGLMLWSSES